MPANQRHRYIATFGNGDHRGVCPLVAEMRCHGPDQNAGGADSDHRPAAAEQVGDMRRRLAEMMRCIRAANRMPVNVGINHFGQPPGDCKPGLRQAQDDRPCRLACRQLIHGSSPL